MLDNLFKEKVVAILHAIIANSNVYSRELANALNDLYKLLEDDNKTDKQINKINPNDWLEPYKPIPACEINDCDHLVYAGNDVYGCRIAEDGLVCDDFNNGDECCMYRQLEYYKEALKAKEQECEELKKEINGYKTIIEKIRQEVQEDVTCESRECGCDSYEECIECLKNTILNIIYEERNDFNNSEKHLEEYAELLQQLDQLKAENETYKKMLEDEEVIFALNEVRTGERHLWYNKAQKLEKALTEIKDFLEYEFYGENIWVKEKILQKISECEVKNER